MEKVFNLEQRELAAFSAVEQEKTKMLAAYGALSMDMEATKKNIDIILEKQRTLVRSTLSARGVEQFDNAQLSGNSIVVNVNESQLMQGAAKTEKPNGVAQQE